MTESKGSRSLNRTNYAYIIGVLTAGASLAGETGHVAAEVLKGKGLDLDPSLLVGAIVGLSVMVLASSPRR